MSGGGRCPATWSPPAPAYLVVFPVMWWCGTRWRFTTWSYVFVMGLAQALGDGGLFFFAANPAMLPFLPYPITNYPAVNVLPFLAVRDSLGTPAASRGALLAVPVVFAAHLVCGAGIGVAGAAVGLE